MTDEILPEDIDDKADAAALESATSKLRAFEDAVFGKDAPRINGAVERGIGSPYAGMTDHQKVHYAALERLVAAEKAVADASAAHAKAHADHAAAEKAALAAEEAAAESE